MRQGKIIYRTSSVPVTVQSFARKIRHLTQKLSKYGVPYFSSQAGSKGSKKDYSGFLHCLNQCCGSGSAGSVCVLDLLDPDPLVQGTDPDPDPSMISKNSKKNLSYYCFVTSL
jgi:hypothetical protein